MLQVITIILACLVVYQFIENRELIKTIHAQDEFIEINKTKTKT